MRTIGLTGGVATGKSTVAQMLREQGACVIDADDVAREVVAIGSPLLRQIADAFAPERVLTERGALDRKAVRRLVSSSSAHRERLNALTHPAIRTRIQERLVAQERLGVTCCVVEAALMVETGSYREYDAVIVTTCPPALQLERIVARDGCDLDAAEAWVRTQASQDSKLAVADHVIRTDCTREELAAAVSELWADLHNL